MARLFERPGFLAFAFIGLVSFWWLHVVLTELGDPFGVGFDTVLWVFSSFLKILVIVALPLTLGAVYQLISKKPRSAMIALTVWFALGTSLVLALAATRETWASVLSTDWAKYYSVSGFLGEGPTDESHYPVWKADWFNGIVVAGEVVLVLALAVAHATIGYLKGHNVKIALVWGYVATIAALGIYFWMGGWFLIDYDFFHGDSVASAVVMDHIQLPIATDPYTSLACLAYLICYISNTFIIWYGKRLDKSSVAP